MRSARKSVAMRRAAATRRGTLQQDGCFHDIPLELTYVPRSGVNSSYGSDPERYMVSDDPDFERKAADVIGPICQPAAERRLLR